MLSDVDILVPSEEDDPSGGYVVVPQYTARLYKEPSNKAKLAKLKQDILGDGVKESKLDKYASLYKSSASGISGKMISEILYGANKYYGMDYARLDVTPIRLTDVSKNDLAYLTDAIIYWSKYDNNFDTEASTINLASKGDIGAGLHIASLVAGKASLLTQTCEVQFIITKDGDPSVTYTLTKGWRYIMYYGVVVEGSAVDLIIVDADTLAIVQPTSGSLNPNNITSYDNDDNSNSSGDNQDQLITDPEEGEYTSSEGV